MPKKKEHNQRSKLGKLIDERNYTLKEFAAVVFEKTGYLIAVTNLSNYATGLKPIKSVEIAKYFADSLEVSITDIL
jgi:hypothetical protein